MQKSETKTESILGLSSQGKRYLLTYVKLCMNRLDQSLPSCKIYNLRTNSNWKNQRKSLIRGKFQF